MTIQFPDPTGHLADARLVVLRRVRRRRRLERTAAAAGVLLAAASVTGAAVTVQQASVREVATGVVCFAHDDLGSLYGAAAQSDGGPGSPTAIDKPAMCALVWRGGLKQAAANGGRWPDIDPNTSTLPVPALAYCRLDDGRTGGFPIESPSRTAAQVCERLGLPEDVTVQR